MELSRLPWFFILITFCLGIIAGTVLGALLVADFSTKEDILVHDGNELVMCRNQFTYELENHRYFCDFNCRFDDCSGLLAYLVSSNQSIKMQKGDCENKCNLCHPSDYQYSFTSPSIHWLAPVSNLTEITDPQGGDAVFLVPNKETWIYDFGRWWRLER